MHWTAAQPGRLDTERELILIDQTPGEIVFVSDGAVFAFVDASAT